MFKSVSTDEPYSVYLQWYESTFCTNHIFTRSTGKKSGISINLPFISIGHLALQQLMDKHSAVRHCISRKRIRNIWDVISVVCASRRVHTWGRLLEISCMLDLNQCSRMYDRPNSHRLYAMTKLALIFHSHMDTIAQSKRGLKKHRRKLQGRKIALVIYLKHPF